jgi:dolichol-phosphate mannosyltransferase
LYAGGILCAVSILLLAYSIGAYFVDQTIRGWTSIMAVILFFLAAQFLVLGLIGEYVGRLYMETKHRPLFIVEDIVVGGRPVSRSAALDSGIQVGYER